MILFAAVILGCYSLLIILFAKGFDKVKVSTIDKTPVKTRFTILIPFRNEDENLPKLLLSLTELNYPKTHFEIILINDHSVDGSTEQIKEFKKNHPTFNLHLINNKNQSISPKKEAIEIGVKKATNPWIITTDADCKVPVNWLVALDNFIQSTRVKMIVLPVTYTINNGFLAKFQLIDFLSLQGTTIGVFGLSGKYFSRPFLCNGANLCYLKEVFQEVDGYEGNRAIASGDDVFLLEKVYDQFPEEVKFLKSHDAIVQTFPKETIQSLIEQRVRWAAKTMAYKHVYGKLIGLIVLATNSLLIILLFLSIFGYFPWIQLGFIFLIKFNIDFILLYKTAHFFNQKEVMRSYFFSAVLYPFFSVIAALLSLKKSYQWKERSYKK